MAFNRSVSVQTDHDEDEDFELFHNKQASATSPGLFRKIKSSLTGAKSKEMKQAVQAYTSENHRLRERMKETDEVVNNLTKRLNELLQSSPYNVFITGDCRNVQLGDNCTVNDDLDTDDMGKIVDRLERLISTLTAAFEESSNVQAKLEAKLKDSEILLKEMTGSLNLCNDKLTDMQGYTDDHFQEVKSLLKNLTSDRSDSRVISQGMSCLMTMIHNQGLLVTDYDMLSLHGKEMITRLVNKYGKLTSKDFAAVIGVKDGSIRFLDGERGVKVINSKLNPNMCTRIIVQFLSQTKERSTEELIHLLQEYDQKRAEENTRNHSEALLLNVHVKVEDHEQKRSPNTSLYSEASAGSTEWGLRKAESMVLPDKRGQFMHILELCKMQTEINRKVDELLNGQDKIYNFLKSDYI
ncbi:hypothetical protein ACF0H5_005074 [Mactra antiquata]